jgi:hypothetical protein
MSSEKRRVSIPRDTFDLLRQISFLRPDWDKEKMDAWREKHSFVSARGGLISFAVHFGKLGTPEEELEYKDVVFIPGPT